MSDNLVKGILPVLLLIRNLFKISLWDLKMPHYGYAASLKTTKPIQ